MISFNDFLYSKWLEANMTMNSQNPLTSAPQKPVEIEPITLPRQKLMPPPVRKLLPPDYKFKEKKVRKGLESIGGGTAKKGIFYYKNTLGIPRNEMPQAKSREHFISWLQDNNIPVSIQYLKPKDVARQNPHAQTHVYIDKAMKFIKNNTLLDKLIILSNDWKVFDGNHHLHALRYKAPKEPVPMYVVEMDFDQLKRFTIDNYPDVRFEETWEDWLGDFGYDMHLAEDAD